MPKSQDKWRAGRGNVGGPRLSLVKESVKQWPAPAAPGSNVSQRVLETRLWYWRKDGERRPASV